MCKREGPTAGSERRWWLKGEKGRCFMAWMWREEAGSWSQEQKDCRFAFVLVCGTGEALRGAEPMGQGQDVPQSSHWLLPGRELQEQGRRPGGWQQAGEVTVAAGVGKALVVALRH